MGIQIGGIGLDEHSHSAGYVVGSMYVWQDKLYSLSNAGSARFKFGWIPHEAQPGI